MKELEKQISRIYKAALIGDSAEVERGFNSLDREYFETLSGEILIEAAIKGHLQVVAKLLEMGADPNYKEEQYGSALHYAARNMDVELAKLLIAYGCDVNGKDGWGNTPLWRAVGESKGIRTMVDFLVQNGADPHIKNNNGKSPYDFSRIIANFPTASFFTDKE